MNPLHYISIRRWNILWPRIKEYIRGMISNAMSPSGDKEVISVLTYDEDAPSSPEENDYYINSEENKLYKYIEDAWVEQDASADCVYIAEDTARVYVYQNSRFSEASGGVVNGIIYMKSIDDVEKINDLHTGVYTAKVGKKAKTIYTLIVKENYAIYQTLYNHWGFYSRTQDPVTREWSDWNEHDYAIKGLIRDNFLVKFDSDTDKLVDAGINADNVASKTDLNAKADKPVLEQGNGVSTTISLDPQLPDMNVIQYEVSAGKIRNFATQSTQILLVLLQPEVPVANECPQWHFFYEFSTSGGAPIYLDDEGVIVEPIWGTEPDWSDGDLIEIDIIQVGNAYHGLWSVKEQS